ncbi:MAG: small multi-drug export protein [Thermoplasmata archaeon]|nr:MAG: small multi-drug export protein [Thermoplasmata archaeon]
MAVEKPLKDLKERTRELLIWLSGFAVFTLIIPGAIIITLPADQRPDGLAVLAAVPILEYLAVSIGIGLDIHPITSFFLTILPCIGSCMLVIGLIGFLGDSSVRATRFLEKVQKRIEKYPRLQKYGVVSNFIFVMILGMYITPGVAIVLGWSRFRSILFMAAGISFITILIGLGTLGIINLFFV